MARLLEQYDKKSMKMTILNQEKIFKEQVYELHRLYQIQKQLMNDMENKGLNRPPTFFQHLECDSQRRNAGNDAKLILASFGYKQQQRPKLSIDLERPAEDYVSEDCDKETSLVGQESGVELTLGIGYSQVRKEISLASNSGPSFSSSTDSGPVQKNIKTHQSMNTLEMPTGCDWGLIQMPASHEHFQSEKNIFVSREQRREGKLDQPPWLFNVLSLNMT